MTYDEMIAVITAYRDGKKIQVRIKRMSNDAYRDIEAPSFNFDACDYRIKPEPKVIWVNEYKMNMCGYSSEIAAKHAAIESQLVACRKYIEVVE